MSESRMTRQPIAARKKPAPPEESRPGEGLSARLRQARKMQNLTLKDVAERAGLSIGLVSQIERGLTTPSMRSLRELAGALGLPVGSLFSHGDGGNIEEMRHIVRKDMRRVLKLDHIGLHMEIFTPAEGYAIQAFTTYLSPGGMSGLEFDAHEGQECGMVIDGQLELFLGSERYLLGPGDSFSFQSTTPHRYWNPGTTMTYLHWMITPPIY